MKLIRAIPQFVVPDVEAAAKYYVEKLGFTLIDYFLDPPAYAMVIRDDVELHFGKSDSGQFTPSHHHRNIATDAYIHVKDLDALHAELQSRGAKIVEGPVARVYGMREIVIEDLNGYRLAFGEDT
jgi:predicted enzyme related to lactoylglutathione lyase